MSSPLSGKCPYSCPMAGILYLNMTDFSLGIVARSAGRKLAAIIRRLMSTAPEAFGKAPVGVDLRNPVSHNRATISGNGPVTVTTAPNQWSYAAAFRFEKA